MLKYKIPQIVTLTHKTFFEKRTYLNTQKVKPLKNSGFTFQFVELEGVSRTFS